MKNPDVLEWLTSGNSKRSRRLKVYHVIGYTQWAGTCKFHVFRDRDCAQLTKKRVLEMAWGTRDITDVITEEEYPHVLPTQICQVCQRRAKQIVCARSTTSIAAKDTPIDNPLTTAPTEK